MGSLLNTIPTQPHKGESRIFDPIAHRFLQQQAISSTAMTKSDPFHLFGAFVSSLSAPNDSSLTKQSSNTGSRKLHRKVDYICLPSRTLEELRCAGVFRLEVSKLAVVDGDWRT